MEAGAEEKGIVAGVASFAEVVSNKSLSFPKFLLRDAAAVNPSSGHKTEAREIVAFQVCFLQVEMQQHAFEKLQTSMGAKFGSTTLKARLLAALTNPNGW